MRKKKIIPGYITEYTAKRTWFPTSMDAKKISITDIYCSTRRQQTTPSPQPRLAGRSLFMPVCVSGTKTIGLAGQSSSFFVRLNFT